MLVGAYYGMWAVAMCQLINRVQNMGVAEEQLSVLALMHNANMYKTLSYFDAWRPRPCK